jgi:hypothetical protein
MEQPWINRNINWSHQWMNTHWKNINHIQLQGWVIGQYTKNTKEFTFQYNISNSQLKLQIFTDESKKSFLLFHNLPHGSLVQVEYQTTSIESLYWYTILRTRYLKMDNKYQWDLKKNNLYGLMAMVGLSAYAIENQFQYVGSHEYHIFQWPHQQFNIYLLVQDDQWKYLVVRRKHWGLHWVIVDLTNHRNHH